MSSIKLKRVKKLSPKVVELLEKHGIVSCKDLLNRSYLELMKILGVSYSSVKDIVHQASVACAPQPRSAYHLHESQSSVLRTSLDQLDQFLHGGLPSATVTEIAGPSGCGKTQFCLMLSVLSTLPAALGGLGGAVLYIDTESAFSAERLVEIAENRLPDQFGTEDSVTQLTQNIYVYTERTCAGLVNRLAGLEADLIRKHIRLVIVDSMASLVRKEFDARSTRNLVERTNMLAAQAARLKYIAETYNIPVVVTNQITTYFISGSDSRGGQDSGVSQGDVPRSLDGEGGRVTVALGNTWSHNVNTRLIVQYLDGPRRQVLIAKSPIAPFASFVYTVQASGICLEDGGSGHYDGTDPGQQHIRVRSAVQQMNLL